MKLWCILVRLGFIGCLWLAASGTLRADSSRIGRFTSSQDINRPLHSGNAVFDADAWQYRITGGGSNMWFGADAFHFLSTKIDGDLVLSAEMLWPEPSKQAHRKAGLMLREDTSPGSRYVDVVLHGDGLISLQYRAEPGGPTREVQAAVRGRPQLRLERWGNYFSASFVNAKGKWEATGCGIELALPPELLAGLLVCSHDDQTAETALFRRVQLATHPFPSGEHPAWRCTLEVVPLGSKDRRVVLAATNQISSPSWSSNGQALAFLAAGQLWAVPAAGGEVRKADPRLFPGRRVGVGQSPDGSQKYYRARRGGVDQIWLKSADSRNPKAMISDNANNWYPHPSMDGRWLLWAAWPAKIRPSSHPAPVGLRMMNLQNGEVQLLAQLSAAKGTMEVSPWSPDSRQVVFVSRHPDLNGWLRSRDGYESAIAKFENSDRTNCAPREAVLFLGSSTIRLWKTLAEDFPGLPWVQRGFGGSKIVDSTYFAERVVFPYAPRVIVFYAGDNDLANHRLPERVLADFREFVSTVHARLPQTRIGFLAIRPSKARWAWIGKTREANRLVAEFCRTDTRLGYLDTFSPTLNARGRPRSEWFEADDLHLNRAGYAAWAQAIQPWLREQGTGPDGS